MNTIKLNCSIFFDAEDIAHTRIQSTTECLKNVFKVHKNPYIKNMQVEVDNNLNDFILRIVVKSKLDENVEDFEAAEMLAPQLAELLDEFSQAHSYLEIAGEFLAEYAEVKDHFKIISESGSSFCDFEPI